ncbi:hypothetical protein [Acerihabitans arboris]|uniref:Uncharacterized protein n=1 Tax=Acerihabitans arboris TaxID=2691583 RepID=A0A845SJ16_9GAMM|nr:hypothetical protein [Acerihabitans arboris]NDL63016.1 hypothetical protein [Acerihabitans arboris]
MENLINPAELCFDDVQGQCQALAYAAYKIEDEDVRELLLYTLIEKQQQLEIRLPATQLIKVDSLN